jgi:hypothetical protein
MGHPAKRSFPDNCFKNSWTASRRRDENAQELMF